MKLFNTIIQHVRKFRGGVIVQKENEKNESATEEMNDTVIEEAEVAEQPEVEDEVKGLLDKLQRTLAEFDNFRKRTSKEKASMYDDGVADTVAKLLPVIDNFERALGSSEDKESMLYKGIEMTFRSFETLLSDLGVTKIEAVGKPFDHNQHFAVAHVEDEEAGENTVVEQLQTGYKYKEKVIRAAMVKVAN